MTEPIREQLHAIVSSIRIESVRSWRIADGPPIDIPDDRETPESLVTDHDTSHVPLVRELRQFLYTCCYARRFDASCVNWPRSVDEQEFDSTDITSSLIAANKSQSGWEPGWTTIRTAPDGEIQVRKGEQYRTPIPGAFANWTAPARRPQVGDEVSVQIMAESHHVQPGMYHVYGETLSDQFDDFNLMRVYFNTSAGGAPVLVETLTTELNRRWIPFQFKCQKLAGNYDRIDAAVLYLGRRYYDAIEDFVRTLPAPLGERLRPESPLFTRPLRPGVGIAEDPGGQRSFGLSRCQLVAEGIVDAWLQDDRTADGCLQAIAGRFSRSGLQLDVPWLNAGSVDFFDCGRGVCAT